ncbi:uncharacterized protein [Anabrus simplex]|uniref:uncharacterized protein isoform X2 n=1 Tax=Anabrus simplex TaxID=316456 RepID=UPI0035A31431
MDLEVKIKDEPICFEETLNTSFENFELVPEIVLLKQETKSELTDPGPTPKNAMEVNFELVPEIVLLKQETKSELSDPGPTQENAMEPSTDIKGEVFIEQQTVDPPVPCVKEANTNILNLYRYI